MKLIPDIHGDRWELIPHLTVGMPTCECCDEGPLILEVGWLFFSISLVIGPPDHGPQL